MKMAVSTSSTRSVTPEMSPSRILTSVHRYSAVAGTTTAEERVEDVDALTGGDDGVAGDSRTDMGGGLGAFGSRTVDDGTGSRGPPQLLLIGTFFEEVVDLDERDGLYEEVDLDERDGLYDDVDLDVVGRDFKDVFCGADAEVEADDDGASQPRRPLLNLSEDEG